MEIFVVIALVGAVLLVAELLLPTGGGLAALGAAALVGAGVVALTADSDSAASDWAGPGLITLGVLSLAAFYLVAGRVVEAQRNRRVRTGTEELVGARAEARTALDPEGQVWVEGSLWSARLTDGEARLRPGDRVRIEAVEGLTLIVSAEPPAEAPTEEGAG